MKEHDALPEEAIEEAEGQSAAHEHGGLDDDEDALLAHLQSPHGLDAPDELSRQTLEGLHDRLHQETDAADR